MTYVMSDLHGQYDKYQKMLQTISFKDSDTLFIVGDICDYGPAPMKIFLDAMSRPNVFGIMGDHDLKALRLLTMMNDEKAKADPDFRLQFAAWLEDGGMPTVTEFRALDEETQQDVLDYIREELVAYDEVTVKGQDYIMIHAGIAPEQTDAIDELDIEALTEGEGDFSQEIFDDKILITGHNPTYLQSEDHRGMIYRRNGQIGIDCGAAEDIALGCLCLDNGKEFYV